jgi:hypothetical protein
LTNIILWRKVQAAQRQEVLDSVDKWDEEVAFFVGLRMEQEATWMQLEVTCRRLGLL